MPFKPHISGKQLAELCHRLAISTESGIDIRRTWEREADNALSRLAPAYAQIRDGVAAGDSLAASCARTGDLFPRLFLEMVQIGEQTGGLPDVFRRLSDHYTHRHKMTKAFLGQIAWPMLQLLAAVVIVGVVIAISGMIKDYRGKPIDILGLGLVGGTGLVLYINLVIACVLVVAGLVIAARRGVFWTGALQRYASQVPVVGPAIQQLSLGRIAWALHLTLNVEMDMRRLIPLVLRASGNDYYIQHTKDILGDVTAGSPMYMAFGRTGVFPPHFLDSLHVAEESGQIVESMDRLSKQYEEEAESAIRTLSVVMSMVVWGAVAALIVVMIFQIFHQAYLGPIQDALEM